MGDLDLGILTTLNSVVGQSDWLDHFLVLLAGNDLLKGGLVMTAWWWAWFARPWEEEAGRRSRTTLLATLAGALVALALARGLAVTLPFRPRPLHDLTVDLHRATSLPPGVLEKWSSMPSDHATLFFALATGLTLVSRRLGLLALAHAALVVCGPRLVLGFHYPSDVLAGTVLGVVCVLGANAPRLKVVTSALLPLSTGRHAGRFYAGLFLLTFQIASLFDALRLLVGQIVRAARGEPPAGG